MTFKLILQIAGVVLGLLYLYLEYKVNIWLWIVGVLMPCVNAVLYYRSGLYADAGMSAYYVLAGIYGLLVWLRDGKTGKDDGKTAVTRTPAAYWIWIALFVLVAGALLYFLLISCTDSTVPFWDASTTALSIAAMWMLSRKYLEQWLVWLVVDVISSVLYVVKGIPLTAGLYCLYSILAVFGYLKWKRSFLG